MSYFISEYFMKVINKDNQQEFDGIKLYVSEDDKEGNYEHLFDLTAPDGSLNPIDNSLFNVQTLKTLCDLGEEAPNIIKDPNTNYSDIGLEENEDWIGLTHTLGLASIKQTYLIWLWMDSVWD